MSKNLKGMIYTLLAASCWGISGVSGQYLMQEGVSAISLTSLRMLISGFVLIMVVIVRQKGQIIEKFKAKEMIIHLLIFSLFGLLANQYTYLKTIYYTNAGTATVLQYIAPSLILTFLCIRERRFPLLSEFIAIVMTMLGTFVMATHANFSALAITPVGLFWGLLAAITTAIYVLYPTKLLRDNGSLFVISFALFIGGLVSSLIGHTWNYPLYISPLNLLAYFGIIGIGTVFAYSLFLKGISMVGPVKASLIASFEPISAVFFTVVIMKEAFNAADIFGMILIIIAVFIIGIKDLLAAKRAEVLAKKRFRKVVK